MNQAEAPDFSTRFERDGYLAVDNVLTDEEVQVLRSSADRLQAYAAGLTASTDRFVLKAFGDDGGGRLLQQVSEPHELGTEWMSLARDQRILDLAQGRQHGGSVVRPGLVQRGLLCLHLGQPGAAVPQRHAGQQGADL